MPTYEYECGSCGRKLEVFQSITERRLRKCPRCGKRSLKRLIGAGSTIIFRGSGFYETDYRRKKAGAESAKDKAPEAKKAGDDSGGDAKAASDRGGTKAEKKSNAAD